MPSPPPSTTSLVEADEVPTITDPMKSKNRTSTSINVGAKNKVVPSTSLSPNPTSNANANTPPSPLQIGKSFIKQYYEVLSTSPHLIQKFYLPNTSVLSHSFLSSVPAESKTLSVTNQSEIFEWATPRSESKAVVGATAGLCFDFGRGAIDAQETIQGGILLVVTGHMKLPNAEKAKAFVHTFFLNNGAPAGKKRQFYVHNDILRFIADSDGNGNDSHTSVSPEPQDSATTKVSTPSSNIVNFEEEISSVKAVAALKPVAQAQDRSHSTPADQKRAISKGEKSKLHSSSNNVTDDYSQVKTGTAKTENKRRPSNSFGSRDESTSKTPIEGGNGKKKNHDPSININNDTASHTAREEKKSKKNKSKGGRSRRDRGKSPSTDKVDSNASNTSRTSNSTTETKLKDSKHNNSGSSSNKPKVPGSWAGVVAGGPGSAAPSASNNNTFSAPPSPSRPSPVAATAAATAAAHLANSNSVGGVEESKDGMDMDGIATPTIVNKSDNSQESTSLINNNITRGGQPPRSNAPSNHPSINNITITQRTAEATLFLKNIPDKTKEADIRSIFEPYATDLNQKILGITLHATRGFCFVDFDAKLVVDTILKDVEASKEANKSGSTNGEGSKFFMHGKFLDVGRKVQVDKGRGSSSQHNRYRNRSSSPGNGAYHKRGGGGGHPHRKNSPRSGNRGSGGQQQRSSGK